MQSASLRQSNERQRSQMHLWPCKYFRECWWQLASLNGQLHTHAHTRGGLAVTHVTAPAACQSIAGEPKEHGLATESDDTRTKPVRRTKRNNEILQLHVVTVVVACWP
eukprot:TRINITY_DN53001_c0_g1_i1.p1 TRINITY_DN53001_c0_g1~~TRINITY_DN53001_c0_g1_i1.p1  ORF type:complete len:108 (+),score=1.48 TRINITY_DN53001_c0_g1_i1:32-355(+)